MNDLRIREAINSVVTAGQIEATSSAKRKEKRELLRSSVASVQLFLASNPLVSGWSSATVLSNLANSIANGIDDNETIPAEDVQEYQDSLNDFGSRYQEYVSSQDDLEEDLNEERNRIVAKTKSVNAVLKTKTSLMGFKALALVSGDIEEIFSPSNDEENDERTVETSMHKFRSKSKSHNHHKSLDASIKDEEYHKIERQLTNVEPYIQKMKAQIPRKMRERFVLLRQPVIVVGSVRYKPSASSMHYVATNGIDLGGYWMLKNQIVLGVATDVSKLSKDKNFRSEVEQRLRDIYEADLERKIRKMKNPTSNAIHKLKLDNERAIKDGLDDEINTLLRQTNTDTLIKLISKRLKYQVVAMHGSTRVSGSPYIYYWLVSDEIKDKVDGLYSEITGWDLPK